jgi:BirA family biotin operon repressor/biotin-[acetyl-CoA-carboxylase] ligase
MEPYRYGMLDAGARRALARTRFGDVRWHDEIDSTNRVLLDLARGGAPEGVVVGADHQTRGRGRLDRTWSAPRGSSLLVSVLLRPTSLPAAHVHMATMVVAVAACEAVAEIAGFRPGLKWPNDLVVGDRKLAGILAEAEFDGPAVAAVVVGIGLNVNWPEPLPAEVAALADLATSVNHEVGHDVDRPALLVRMLGRLDEHYGALLEPGGWRATLRNYRSLCVTLGRDVRVERAGGPLVGRAVEVTPEGHLVVEADGRLEHVAAGDVIHVRPA